MREHKPVRAVKQCYELRIAIRDCAPTNDHVVLVYSLIVVELICSLIDCWLEHGLSAELLFASSDNFGSTRECCMWHLRSGAQGSQPSGMESQHFA